MANNWDDEDHFEDAYESEDDYHEDHDDEEDDEPNAWYECPSCGAEVYDEADICPSCENYIVPKLVSRSDLRPLWYVFLGMAGLIAVIVVLSGLLALLG